MTDVVIDIRVIPRGNKTQIGGERDGAVVVRLAAPPADGAANEALIEFLAATLGLPRRSIGIVSERTRQKRVAISGATAETVNCAAWDLIPIHDVGVEPMEHDRCRVRLRYTRPRARRLPAPQLLGSPHVRR